ncbi:MAG: MFS transporter [Chloroflexi bacterium]|nr:MFS transporter [Chloroflexota bacterium]
MTSPPIPAVAVAPDTIIRPLRTLWLLSTAHAVNHAHAALLPLVYLAVISEFAVGAGAVAFVAAVASFASGVVQLSFGALTRVVSRRAALVAGNFVMGAGLAAHSLASGLAPFAIANVISRMGGSPQHPVGNALLAEQFPPERRGFAISAHIAGGNVGTLAVPLVGAWLIAGIGWRWTVVLFGVPAMLIAVGLFALVRESGADRAAAREQGTVREGYRSILRDRDLLWLYLSSVLGGGGRGLGVVNIFVPIYLARVIGLDAGTVALMYTVLLIGSVPGPLLAGWLSDRLGRKPVIVATYLLGAFSFGAFVLAGSSVLALWLGIVLLSAFNFVESPQLQALLADITPTPMRDVSFAAYFTLAFGIGSLWTAVYGIVIEALGEAAGLPLVFLLMGAAYVVAALAVLPIRAEERARLNADPPAFT